jgi:hypothetical protein
MAAEQDDDIEALLTEVDGTAKRPQRRTVNARIVDASFWGGFQLGLGFIAAVWAVNVMIALAVGVLWWALMLIFVLFG